MTDIVMKLIDTGYIVPLGVVSLGILVAIVGQVTRFLRKHHQTEVDAALKHKMLDAGMSAEDIKKVLEASSSGRSSIKSGSGEHLKATADYKG